MKISTRNFVLAISVGAWILFPWSEVEAGGRWRWSGASSQCATGSCPTAGSYVVQAPQGYQAPPGYATYQAVPVSSVLVPSAAASVSLAGGDRWGIVGWLNAVRGSRGLGGVVWDEEVAIWAVENSRRGFGHVVRFGGWRQNVGMGALPTVQAMWLSSPAHASALLDPWVTRVGLGYANGVWTLNLR